MPIYEFQCPNGQVTEKWVKMGTEKIECPHCGGVAERILSPCTFTLKGGGWYADGYSNAKGGQGSR